MKDKKVEVQEAAEVQKEEIQKTPEEETAQQEPGRSTERAIVGQFRSEEASEWVPRTQLGKRVLKGEFRTIEDVLRSGELILEPGIVDYLVPDMKSEIVYIGGSPGKGGGIRRTATKRTARMHKSGRRFKLTALVVVGNSDGIVGVGKASSKEHRIAIEKATEQAKLRIIRVRRKCGSWECGCDTAHSIPFRSESKYGSVRVVLIPAPRGTGIVASKAGKKILGLAGLKDVYVKTHGQTGTRTNLIYATFGALKNLNRTKGVL
jgi:small subunit ribosomal protein S5